jgi:putative oxidoreductase
MKQNLQSIGLLWLRVLMGAGIATHGYGKIFGGRMDKFAEGIAEMGLPLPEVAAWAAALSEFAGGIFVAIGLGTRIAAFFIFATMSVAAFIRHAPDPFNVKELALAYWTMAGALIVTGAGPLSLDALIGRRLKAKK